MRSVLRLFLAAVATISAVCFSAVPGSAQSWPTQRVTVVVPFGAGSITDILARIFADEMSKRWGQPVVVENRPGMAGMVAVAKAAPDGYTLMVTSNGHTIAGLINKDTPFDPVKDFAGITRIGLGQVLLFSYPGTPAKNLKELIDLAKKDPGKLNYASPGLASTTFIAGALFRKAAGVNIVHVPYRSVPEALTSVIRGDAQMIFAPVTLAREHANSGKLIAIASATKERMPEMPNVPTFAEGGLNFSYDTWNALLAPHGTPKAVLDKIAKDWGEALKTSDVGAKIKGQHLTPAADEPGVVDKMIKDETEILTQIFKESGL